MIKLVEDGWLSHYPGRVTGKGWLVFVLGDRALQVSPTKIHKREYADLMAQQRNLPIYIVTLNGLNYWQFYETVYSDNQGLVAEQVYAVLVGLDLSHLDEQQIA